jgi:hypothetical protein
MSRTPATPEEAQTYEVRLRGKLDARWADRLGVANLAHEAGGITVLRCAAADQPALHGLLQRVRDLGLPLISVTLIESDQTTHTTKG